MKLDGTASCPLKATVGSTLPPPSEGRLCLPPHPHPNRRGLKPAPPLVVLAGLTLLRLSSSSVTGCSPPSAEAEGGGTGSFLFLIPWSLPALVGRRLDRRLFSLRHRQFSGLALKGGPESLLFLALIGGSVASPRPPSNRRAASGSPPLVVVAGFTFLPGTPRQFSCLASIKGGGQESFLVNPVRLLPALVGRVQQAAPYSRSSSRRSPGSPLQGGRESLLLLSLRAVGSKLPTFGTRPCLPSRR